MNFYKPLSIPALLLIVAATGCIDNNYDLSDIDKNVQLSVNELTVPIKIDQITLKSIISDNDLDIIDGAYAYTRTGSFTTAPVSIPGVQVEGRDVEPIVKPVSLPGVSQGTDMVNVPVSVDLNGQMSDFEFNASGVSPDILAIYSAGVDCTIDVTIEVKGMPASAEYTFKDFELKMPYMLKADKVIGAQYDKANNRFVVNTTTADPVVKVTCHFDAIDFGSDGLNLETSHSIALNGEVGLVGGQLTVRLTQATTAPMPDKLDLAINYSLGDIDIKSVDALIRHDITDVKVPEIDITGLPDVLMQPGTNLVLANPCLYLSVANPLSVCGLYAQTGLEVKAYRGDDYGSYSIDAPYFKIDANARDLYCLSPKMPANVDAAYAGCTHVPFSNLGRILSGAGLPDYLQVALTDPCIPSQRVSGFKLGYDYGNIDGEYKFVAPLQFAPDTRIVYSDRIDDWGEDVQKMTVTALTVNLNVTTDVPVRVELSGYPLDKSGNRMANVTISGATIEANAQDQPVQLTVSGTVKGLDGIEFEAKAYAVDGNALSPDMHIGLTNIRPCVSGYYDTEL